MATLDEYLNAGSALTGATTRTGTTTGSTGTTTGSTGTTTATYNPDPYDWNRLLAYYKSPTDISSMYQLQDRPATPQYGYEYTQMRAAQGNPVAPRYNVADPTSPTSATAAQILADYNTRKGKTETALTQAILNDYVTNYNTANNAAKLSNISNFNTLDQSIQDMTNADAALTSWLASHPNAKQSDINSQRLAAANRAIASYNLANDTNAAAQQGTVVNEFNTARTNQQSAYDKGLADYNTLAADVKANPQQYYKPIQQYEQPVVQNAYYNKFVPKQEQQVTAAHGGYIQGYANGGMVQPQMPMQQPVVQDLLQQYNTPRQPIGPLGSLRGRQ